jgi:molybdate transport repressor ModE-like protein
MVRVTVGFSCVVKLGGRPVLDDFSARVLRAIEEKSSIIAASRALGIPYTSIWETISRIEKLAGGQVIAARRGGRGGGGARLTMLGRRLLRAYDEGVRMLATAGLSAPLHPAASPQLLIAHSSDPLLSMILEQLSQEGHSARCFCVGSGLSLAMLSLEEVDVAGIHLYDPTTGSYNGPYLERFWLGDRVVRLGGYERQLVMAYGERVRADSLDVILRGLLAGELRLANRNRGSGTRIYLDHLLEQAGRIVNTDPRLVRGYEREYHTHEEVARSIASGETDAGLLLRYVADEYDLQWIHVTWERYEYYALKSRTRSDGVQGLKRILESSWLDNILSSMPGYRRIEE